MTATATSDPASHGLWATLEMRSNAACDRPSASNVTLSGFVTTCDDLGGAESLTVVNATAACRSDRDRMAGDLGYGCGDGPCLQTMTLNLTSVSVTTAPPSLIHEMSHGVGPWT